MTLALNIMVDDMLIIRWWKRALRLREDFHFSNWPDSGSKVIRIFPVLLVFDQSFIESFHRRVEADICGSHFIPPTSHQVSWSFLLLIQFLSSYTYLLFQRLFHLAVPAWQRPVGSHSCDCYSNHSGPGGSSSQFCISYTNVLTESSRSLSSKSGLIGSALRLNLDIID